MHRGQVTKFLHKGAVDVVFPAPQQGAGKSEAKFFGHRRFSTKRDQFEVVLLRLEGFSRSTSQGGTQIVVQNGCRAHGKNARFGAGIKGHRGAVAHSKQAGVAFDGQIGGDFDKPVDQRQIGIAQPSMGKRPRSPDSKRGLHGILRPKDHLIGFDLFDRGIDAQGHTSIVHRLQKTVARTSPHARDLRASLDHGHLGGAA